MAIYHNGSGELCSSSWLDDKGHCALHGLPAVSPVPLVEPPRAAIFRDDAHAVYAGSLDVLVRKHEDYGPDNIARAPGGPLMGLAVRLHDKVARLAHLLENGATPENESLADTFLDITNYGAIGQMVLGGTWPGVTGTKSAGVEK